MFSMPSQNERELQTLESHSTELDLPVFTDGQSPIITAQPISGEERSNAPHRRPIPVSTVDWQSNQDTLFTPLSGLSFLDGVDQLYVQQTIELHDLLSNQDSENRYVVKVPRGETLYYCDESSKNSQRMCLGSSRSFTMRLFDQTRQEAMEFRRRLACGTCTFWCYLQVLEVWLPPGELVGSIKQEMSMSTPIFLVWSRHNEVLFRIEGPKSMCACVINPKDVHFKIFNGEGTTQLGSINHQWDQVANEYILSVQLPGRNIESKKKALLLGAAFLFEYMYFERSKKSSFSCSC